MISPYLIFQLLSLLLTVLHEGMKDVFLGLFFFVFIYLVAVPHGMWDPGSPAPG